MGHVITFYYDALGRLVGADNKDGTHVSTTYDANGNTLTTTDEEAMWSPMSMTWTAV